MNGSLLLGTGENAFLGVYRRKILLPRACIFNTRQGWRNPVAKLPGSYQRGMHITVVNLSHHWGNVLAKALVLLPSESQQSVLKISVIRQ